MAQTWEIKFKHGWGVKPVNLFEQWNVFPREIVNSLSLEILGAQLDTT